MKNVFLSIFLISCIIAVGIFGSSCANIIPPSGGPRDSLPPVLVNAMPKDSTVNFKASHITLTFDEFIDLQDVQQNLLFTPTFEVNPLIEAKLRTLTLRLKDSLQPNTTYTFNFGNALRDVNEGNILKNFTYVFSTGPVLDSLQLSGKVILAENGKTDSTLIVLLYKDRTDSAVVKERPTYIARLDSAGRFRFRNLPKDTFALYALGDAGGGRRYLNKNQLFAFANQPVIPGTTGPDTLYAYKEVPENKTSAATQTAAKTTTDKRLRFTANINNNQKDLLTDLTITFERPLRLYDSTKLSLTTDSTFNPVAHTAARDTSDKVVTVKTNWKEGTLYHLILDKDFAEDTLGRRLLKTDTLSFTTQKRSDYGNLNLRIRNIDTALNPVLQFVQNDAVVYSAPIKSGVLHIPLFVPGDYDLRILYDRNNNGKWDPGQFFGTKIQPERVKPIDQKITVKPDWDNEFERSLQ